MPTARIVDVQGERAIAVVVSLYPPARRPVRVTTAGNAAVVGTKLQLVERATDHPIDGETTMMKRVGNSASTSAPNRGWLAHETKTNAKGEAELAGHRNGEYALRLLGPGHLPVVVQDVVLDPSLGPLEVRVALGATVRGKLRPLKVLDHFQPPQRILDHYKRGGGASQRILTGLYPGVNLEAKGRGVFPASEGTHPGRVPLNEDGSFEISGIPPGTWALNLAYNEFSGGGWSCQRQALETLHDLKDGEVRKVDLDIAHLQKAKVLGRVFLNGEPMANVQVNLATFKADASGGRTMASSVGIKTDAAGRFTKRVLSGTYIINCYKTINGRHVSLQGEGELQVGVGEDVHRDFHIRTAALRIRLLAADGKTPLSGIQAFASTADGTHGFTLPSSDEDGHTQLPMGSLGVYELRIWPKMPSSAPRSCWARSRCSRELEVRHDGTFWCPPWRATRHAPSSAARTTMPARPPQPQP
jgi:hypothetical protein